MIGFLRASCVVLGATYVAHGVTLADELPPIRGQCAAHSLIETTLRERYGETVVVAMTGGGEPMQIYVNPESGSWTTLRRQLQGDGGHLWCIVGSGQDWQFVEPTTGGRDAGLPPGFWRSSVTQTPLPPGLCDRREVVEGLAEERGMTKRFSGLDHGQRWTTHFWAGDGPQVPWAAITVRASDDFTCVRAQGWGWTASDDASGDDA